MSLPIKKAEAILHESTWHRRTEQGYTELYCGKVIFIVNGRIFSASWSGSGSMIVSVARYNPNTENWVKAVEDIGVGRISNTTLNTDLARSAVYKWLDEEGIELAIRILD